jgi:hypothetical protein
MIDVKQVANNVTTLRLSPWANHKAVADVTCGDALRCTCLLDQLGFGHRIHSEILVLRVMSILEAQLVNHFVYLDILVGYEENSLEVVYSASLNLLAEVVRNAQVGERVGAASNLEHNRGEMEGW